MKSIAGGPEQRLRSRILHRYAPRLHPKGPARPPMSFEGMGTPRDGDIFALKKSTGFPDLAFT